MGVCNQQSSTERREYGGEMFKTVRMMTMLKPLRLLPLHVSIPYVVQVNTGPSASILSRAAGPCASVLT